MRQKIEPTWPEGWQAERDETHRMTRLFIPLSNGTWGHYTVADKLLYYGEWSEYRDDGTVLIKRTKQEAQQNLENVKRTIYANPKFK
jgi:hypothetical protein